MVKIPPELRYKFSDRLLAELDKDPPVKVVITFGPGIAIAEAAGSLASLGAQILYQSELTHQVSVIIGDEKLPQLAAMPHVANIYHVPQGEIREMIPLGGIEPVEGLGLAAVSVTLEDTTNFIGAPKMWDKGFKGQGIKVGVIDTGIDAKHPMLLAQVVAEKDFTGTNTMDNHGHGTWVGSAIAGKEWMSPQGLLIGVAPQAQLVSAKAFEGAKADLDVIMQALEWAALQGCQVLNNSWGGEDYPPLHALVKAIHARGQVIVAAAGNGGPFQGSVEFPGGYPEVIAVGAMAVVAPATDAVANFSARGPGPSNMIKPDLVAPGGSEEECIIGAAPQGATACIRGTSMATPHVAGAIAVLLSAGKPGVPLSRSLGVPDNVRGNGALSLDPSAVPVPAGGASAFNVLDWVPAVAFGVAALAIFGFALSR